MDRSDRFWEVPQEVRLRERESERQRARERETESERQRDRERERDKETEDEREREQERGGFPSAEVRSGPVGSLLGGPTGSDPPPCFILRCILLCMYHDCTCTTIVHIQQCTV